MHICIYTHTYAYMCIYTHVHTGLFFIYTCMYVYIHMCVHIHTDVYTHDVVIPSIPFNRLVFMIRLPQHYDTFAATLQRLLYDLSIRTRMQICMCIYIYIYTHVYIHVHTHYKVIIFITFNSLIFMIRLPEHFKGICMIFQYVLVCKHVCVYTYIHMYIYVYIHTIMSSYLLLSIQSFLRTLAGTLQTISYDHSIRTRTHIYM